jgi:integrase/recombinase XerD
LARKFIAERGATASPKVQRTGKVRRTVLDELERYTIDEALEIFIRAKEAEGVRPRTIKDYRQHIRYLLDYIGRQPFYLDELTAQLIRDYINYLRKERNAYEGVENREKETKGLSVNTINIRLRTLRTMCNFWYAEGMIAENPMQNIKPVRDDEHEEVPGLSDEEIEKILNYFDEKQYAEWRDKTLILLLLDTGLRINEAVNLTIDQIDFKRLSIHIPSSTAKNRRGRDVPVSREVARRLRQLYEENQQYFGKVDEIFMNAYGEPFTADTFRRRLNRLKKKLNIEKLHPHMFRHTFARNYILNGGDIFTLQKILDHADIKTTRKYIQMDDEHIREQHNKYSPIRRLLRRI